MYKTIPFILIPALAACGLALRPGESEWFFENSRSIIWLPIFLLLFSGLKQIIKNKNKRLFLISSIPALILSGFNLFGTVITEKNTALWIVKNINTISFSILYFLAVFLTAHIIIYKLFESFLCIVNKETTRQRKPHFLVFWIILIVCWLPWMLNQFPAVMTADTTDQIEMALGLEPLTDHHPVFYTLLIKAVFNISHHIDSNGNISFQSGAALFSITQFLLMSGLFAAVLTFINRTNAPRGIKTAVLLFFVLYPIHALYSVTMWKDVPFAVCLLILISFLFAELQEHNGKNCIGIAISGLLMSLLRHNGIYLIALSIPFIPAVFNTKRKSVFSAFLIVLLLYFGWQQVLLPALKIPGGEPAEAFSIPLQQIALTAKRQHTRMNEETLKELNAYFRKGEIWELYNYRISDPVKNEFNNDLYKQNPINFWKFWTALGKSYPQDYLDAALLHTYGYWYPSTPHWVFITGIDDNGLFGIHMDPKLDTPQINSTVQWFSDSKYDEIPLLSLIFSPGACLWLYVIGFFYCLYRKSPVYFLYIPLFTLWLTALASPVNCEYRYVYGMFLCSPIVAAAMFNQNNSN